MAKGNGHDPMTVRLVEVLERIEVHVKGTNDRLDALNARVDALTEDVHALRADVTTIRNDLGSLRMEAHPDLDEMRAELRAHEQRFLRLEEAVFKKAG
jgi:FtsZ-binding cell division protein ZapB